MGHPDLSDGAAPRGLVIFPADEPAARARQHPSEWWLVPAALVIAVLLIAIAFAVR